MALLSKLIDKSKDFISGVGSILQIYPASNQSDHIKIIKRDGFEEYSRNISKYWENVGNYMHKSMNQY